MTDDLEHRLRHHLAKRLGQTASPRSDFDLNPHMLQRPKQETLTDAAVLVPVIEDRSELTVLLTKRANELPSHAGQISFPGGRVHQQDRDLVDTALRETYEEVGIGRDQVTIAGYLDTYETGTGYCILPVVGLIKGDLSLNIDAREVAEAFEVPLSFLMNPANHLRHSFERDGTTRHYYAMPYQGYYIWGATAGILKMLYDRLYAK